MLARLIDAVGLGDRTVGVAGQREVQPAQPAPRDRRGHPALVQVDRVTAHPQEVALLCLELLEPLAEPDQLGRADEREVAGIEQQERASGPGNLSSAARCRDGSGNRVQGRSNGGAGLPIRVEIIAELSSQQSVIQELAALLMAQVGSTRVGPTLDSSRLDK